jgi:hypothetical protein
MNEAVERCRNESRSSGMGSTTDSKKKNVTLVFLFKRRSRRDIHTQSRTRAESLILVLRDTWWAQVCE